MWKDVLFRHLSDIVYFFLAFCEKKEYKTFIFYALVAQLDRVLPSEGKGREFESRQVRQKPPLGVVFLYLAGEELAKWVRGKGFYARANVEWNETALYGWAIANNRDKCAN